MDWKFKYYDIEKGVDFDSLEKECEWFRDMADVQQDEIWHAEGNVQIHTKMVVEALISLPEFQQLPNQYQHIMVTAALMHDIEKRSTTEIMFNGRENRLCVVAPRHAAKGEYTARRLLYTEFDCPYKIRELICKVVKYHGIPLWDSSEEAAEKRIISSSMVVPNNLLVMIAKADILGRECWDNEQQLDKIEEFQILCEVYDCWDKPYQFSSDLAKFEYFTKNKSIHYTPYDDKKFTVTMMSALPGSGKDTYIKQHLSDIPMVSLDDIRVELKVKPTDKKGNGRVIQLAKERAKEHMRAKRDFVWNATNITKNLRGQIIDLFESYGGKVNIVYVEVPYKTMLSQNKSREAEVPQKAIDKMLRGLEPPTTKECNQLIIHSHD